ncbi:MAG: tetratricopeptide repeat protein [Bacteroidia bacterium]|nr:tetratricopeptide repeat protein [Bacteroidia bacterium]
MINQEADCKGCQYNRQYTPEEMAGILEEMTSRAEKGDVESMAVLGTIYSMDKWVHHDYEKAYKWLTLAAKKNDVGAIKELANGYYYGYYGKVDYGKCFKLIQKAADMGDEIAMNNLASLYEEGEGVERNYKLALKWYERAADAGYDCLEDIKKVCTIMGIEPTRKKVGEKKEKKEKKKDKYQMGCLGCILALVVFTLCMVSIPNLLIEKGMDSVVGYVLGFSISFSLTRLLYRMLRWIDSIPSKKSDKKE